MWGRTSHSRSRGRSSSASGRKLKRSVVVTAPQYSPSPPGRRRAVPDAAEVDPDLIKYHIQCVDIEREPLREGIRRRLVDSIVAGTLGPGDRIRLSETAEAIGVSMTPLRESLVQLEREGFVRSDPGRGYAVPELDPEEVRQLYPLVWTLEVLALRSAPPAADTVNELERLNERFAAQDEPEAAARLDRAWHRTLLAGCGNELLLELLSVLKARAARYELAYMRETGNVGMSADQHARIAEDLRAGDLDAAAATLEENWRIGPEVLLPWLEAR